jgi:phosphomannomutase/phosphoglucomutase
MVTASHNPAEYNGFKISMNKKPLLNPDYLEILSICQRNEFVSGEGKVENYDIFNDYLKEILEKIKLNKKLKVAIDCANGTVSLFAGKLLKELGCEVVEVFCESDGSFPNHQPYPQKSQLYSVLKKTIIDEKCDIGLSFDGDGDRLGVYDEKGNFVQNDRLAMLFARDISQKNKNLKIVMNISTSISVIDYIKSLGAEFILWKTGYPLITEKMKEVGSIFGGEISGHFFFKDKYYGFDDALYAGTRILEILSNLQNSFSNEISIFPKYFETNEFRVEVPNGIDRFSILPEISQKIKKDYPQCEITLIDGVRFDFNDSWGLVRGSNTEPLLTGRAEGKTEQALENIKKIIKDCLSLYKINIDWSLFE